MKSQWDVYFLVSLVPMIRQLRNPQFLIKSLYEVEVIFADNESTKLIEPAGIRVTL